MVCSLNMSGDVPVPLAQAGAGDEEAVKEYLSTGDVGILDEFGRGLLHHACQGNQTAIVKMLLAASLPPSPVSALGDVPFHWVSAWGNIEALSALLQAGADINHADKDGFTPLHWSVAGGSKDCVIWLLENGADVMAENGFYLNTPLHEAARWGCTEIAKVLIDHGADVFAENIEGKRALEIAIERDRPNTTALLEAIMAGSENQEKDHVLE
eukprot:comp19995_c0_seq1/m.24463 comp19995_c0_seq1/g.24463  ORF comp19995_c0_seq1/g.24463 comp19995_c0_seq1/m.24463 type:complete len:212 (-) comp19995_c0_seq1:14-649(-)